MALPIAFYFGLFFGAPFWGSMGPPPPSKSRGTCMDGLVCAGSIDCNPPESLSRGGRRASWHASHAHHTTSILLGQQRNKKKADQMRHILLAPINEIALSPYATLVPFSRFRSPSPASQVEQCSGTCLANCAGRTSQRSQAFATMLHR